MSRRAATAIVLLLAAATAAARDASGPGIVPNPASLVRLAGSFSLSAQTPIVTARQVLVQDAARTLADRLWRIGAPKLVVTTGDARDGAVVLVRDDGLRGEAYRLEVTPRRITLRAATLAGFTHAGTTLWQLMEDAKARPIPIAAARIDDAPRFAWRGVMLDSARHYQSPEFILRFIDALAAHKLNVFHWHLTDDQAWRLEIRKYPRLTSVSAWRVPAGPAARADIDAATGKARLHGGYYTQAVARRVVAYAADRGITVVPEIDLPGHASAAIAAYPELGASSTHEAEVPSDWGIYANVYNLDEHTLAFMQDVLTEVMDVFPGEYIHVGGDEVQTRQWKDSPRVQARMRELGIASVEGIQPWLTRRIGRFLESHGRRLVGWDEILEGAGLPASAVVMSWRGVEGALAAAQKGHDAVVAAHPALYFDNRQSADAAQPPGRGLVVSLEDVYRFQPLPAQLPAAQQRHILGLQANLWTEHVRTEERVGWMAFPRAAAVAELGWSRPGRQDWDDFRRRVANMPARYEALRMTYAKSAFDATPVPRAATSRKSQELDLCSANIALWLEDDAPLEGPRAVFLVDIMNPCWIWRAAPLGGVQAIEARVGQVPFNFRIGDDVRKITFAQPLTPEGELEVHADTCEGELLARLPVAPAAASFGTTTLPRAAIPPRHGARDLCFRFAQPRLEPLWVLDSIRLVRRGP